MFAVAQPPAYAGAWFGCNDWKPATSFLKERQEFSSEIYVRFGGSLLGDALQDYFLSRREIDSTRVRLTSTKALAIPGLEGKLTESQERSAESVNQLNKTIAAEMDKLERLRDRIKKISPKIGELLNSKMEPILLVDKVTALLALEHDYTECELQYMSPATPEGLNRTFH